MSNDDDHRLDGRQASDRRILWQVLLINLAQCIAGFAVGAWASSTAVMGAALDNLADASVYGVSLYAVGRSAAIKARAARLSGWLLIGLAVLMLSEVLRRFFGGEAPLGPAMMTMAAVNAGMNLFCLRLLKRHKGKDVNFKASSIFTSNDSIVNLAIVASGALVMWLGSNLPDLILGMVVSAIAFKGGREILAEARESTQVDEADAS
ncbi:cation transporter [Tepidimonas aquatica]|uniref:Zinc transporter ZitB n=1 Tax=Tepidimonas aquatica TaxID=247482 RepID=A0A554W4E9_9BURK|nr:cation transporter [Tepidimonas aquatica]TSE18458.1 Zinc transporter ZitB [Tepidimonas aquatica]